MFLIPIEGRAHWVRFDIARAPKQLGFPTPKSTRVHLVGEFGRAIFRLSVEMGVELPTDDHFWLKDWAENQVIVAELLKTGRIVIDDNIAPIRSGFVTVRAARIT